MLLKEDEEKFLFCSFFFFYIFLHFWCSGGLVLARPRSSPLLRTFTIFREFLNRTEAAGRVECSPSPFVRTSVWAPRETEAQVERVEGEWLGRLCQITDINKPSERDNVPCLAHIRANFSNTWFRFSGDSLNYPSEQSHCSFRNTNGFHHPT